MGFLGGESTEDADLRPGLTIAGIATGVMVIQVAVFPHSSEAHWLRLTVELLLIPIPVAGAFIVGGVRHMLLIWQPLCAGAALFAVYAVGDAIDGVVTQPETVTLVFEDGTLLVGSVALAVGMVQWPTHRDARKTELRRRNDRLDQFTSVITHDLRNPLNITQMRLELAREGHGTEHLSTIAGTHDRMEVLIQDVLQLAHVSEEVGEVEPVSLATVTADMVTNTSLEASGLTVEAGARLFTDRGQLTAAFENLSRNAVEHGSTSRRESLGETAGHDVPTKIPSPATDKSAADTNGRRARADADGETPDVNVRVDPLKSNFFVEDDGPGVPSEEQGRIFESGYSTDSRGTGLGLAIVADVASTHGWGVTTTTGKDEGARFEFRGVSFAAESEISTSGPRP